MIRVSFLCNDPDNGNPIGKCSAIEIDTIHGCENLEFEHYAYGMTNSGASLKQVDKPKDAPDRCDGGFKLGRKVFPCTGWKYWYGNWCWDMTRMTGVDVLNLIWYLQENGWRCVAATSELHEAFNSGDTITKEMVQDAL